MAPEQPRIIRPKSREQINLERLNRKRQKALKRQKDLFSNPAERISLEKFKRSLLHKRREIVHKYSLLTRQERTKLFEDLQLEIKKIFSDRAKGETGFFGEKEPVMRKRFHEIKFELKILDELIKADKLNAQKKGANTNNRQRPNSEMTEGLDKASAVQVNSRGTRARAVISANKAISRGPIRVVDRNGNVVKPKGTPSGARVKTTEPVRQLPSGGRKRPSREEPTPEQRSDFMQQEVVPKPGESRRGVQGELDLRVGPKKGPEKTSEQARAETMFITFIRENPGFRARFTEFNQFFEWVKTTFNFTDARQVHQTIINLFSSKESRIDLKVLIETQQQVINILKASKSRDLSEADLRKIKELIDASESRLSSRLNITKEELLEAIGKISRDVRLSNADMVGKILGDIKKLEGKVDEMSEDLKTILDEIQKDRNLSAEDRQFIESEFVNLQELIWGSQRIQGGNIERVLESLDSLHTKLNPLFFEALFKRVISVAIEKNNTTLISQISNISEKKWKGRYTQILERFAEVRNLIRDLGVKVKDIPEMIRKLEQFLSKFTQFTETTNLNFQRITEAIEALKPLTEEQIKTILEKVIEKADLPKKVLEKMQDYFKNNPEFGEVIRDALEAKFTAIENKMDTIRDELKNAIENSGLTKGEKEVLFDQLNHLIAEIAETKTLSAESRDMLLKLKEKFPDDKTLEEIMKPILETTILENNEKIQQMLVDMGLAKSSEIADLKSSFEERLAALEEKIDEKGDKGDKGDDGKGGKDGKGETETGGDPAKKDPKPGFWKKAGMMLNKNLGGSLLLIAIIAIVYAAIVAAQKAPTKIAQNYSITPVFGETLKTASTTSSSLLGSLGGINPLIIIGVVVVLFLLFPKK